MLSQNRSIDLPTSAAPQASPISSTLSSTLQQAVSACQQEDWKEVVAACQQVIAVCNQKLAAQQQAQLNSEKVPERVLDARADQSELDKCIHLASLSEKEQSWSEAVRYYQQALTLLSPQKDAQTSQANQPQVSQKVQTVRVALAKVLFKQAEQLKHQGDITSAVRHCLQALQHHPLFYQVYSRLRYNLIRYDLKATDAVLKEIVSVCRDNIAQHPHLSIAYVTLGYALTKQGRIEDAIAYYQQASKAATPKQLKEIGSKGLNAKRLSNDSTAKQPRLKPSFIVIGAEKCGTTSLYQYLSNHPQILAPIEKEIDFFDLEYDRGLDWYLSHFPASPTGHADSKQSDNQRQNPWISGETSANYLYGRDTPKRIFEQFPQIQLVVLLRNPVDRTLSRYNMMVRNGVEKRSFEQAIAEEIQIIERFQKTNAAGEGIPWSALNRCRHLGNSLYAIHLQRWLNYFSTNQLLVLRSEDLFTHPAQTLATLCQTLGISTPPQQPYQKYNAGEYDSVPKAVRQRLFDFYQPHIRQLETLLKQPFDWTLS